MHGRDDVLFRPDSLVRCGDFVLGETRLQPSVRRIDGPGGAVVLEPRMMQVLVALVEAQGTVVTRAALEQRCWGGTFVSDHSINRAIAGVRRGLREVASDVEVETIARSGYRLLSPAGFARREQTDATGPMAEASAGIGRRHLLAGAGALAGLAGLALVVRGGPKSRRVDELLQQAERAWTDGLPDSDAQGVGFARAATALQPDRAATWGWLAVLERTAIENAAPDAVAGHVRAAEHAARRGLAINEGEGNALAALAALPPVFGDWKGTRARLERVLAVAPDSRPARDHLGLLEMSMGRVAQAGAIVDRLAADDPLAAIFQHKRIYRLWSQGRVAEMDRAADSAVDLWPRHLAIVLARIWTLAFTGRPAAASALLNASVYQGGPMFGPLTRTMASTFRALESGTTKDRQSAIEANLATAARGPGGAVGAINHLNALGDIDAAFKVADGYYRQSGDLLVSPDAARELRAINEMRWKKTMMLWLPVTAPMRADPRFAAMMQRIGLTDAWQQLGRFPDGLRG